MHENREFVVPVNILTPFLRTTFFGPHDMLPCVLVNCLLCTCVHNQVMKSKTVCEMLVRAAEEFAGLPCLGYRQVHNGTPEKSFKWLVHVM